MTRVVAAADRVADAPPIRLRRALALLGEERLVEAIATLEALVRDVPQSPSAWQALGAARRAADDAPGAGIAFEHVLRLRPADSLGLLSRAQVAADLGRPAAPLFTRALAADPASAPARLGAAAALAGEGRADAAITLLRDGLARDPDWREGWSALASLTYRFDGKDAFQVAARAMFAARPRNAALMLAAIRMLARVDEHGTALDWIVEARARTGDSPPLRLVEAEALDAVGRSEEAGGLLDALAPLREPVVDLARARHALRTGAPDLAAELAQRLLDGPGRGIGWAYLGTAWRMRGDARADWLERDERLVGAYDLGLSCVDLMALAERLRTLHHARHAPFEQSMRGGTQTEGLLLSREEPEIRRLRAALIHGLRAHIDALPAHDPAHPTLGVPRSRTRFTGSWSVRLTGGGHHVNHVHSEGWLSSAVHIVLPATSGLDSGALTLGEPPRELRTGLAPRRIIQPIAGRVVLFPSIMWHGTTAFSSGERLTVAFDARPLV